LTVLNLAVLVLTADWWRYDLDVALLTKQWVVIEQKREQEGGQGMQTLQSWAH
jgi:hypothetical protein